MTKSIKVIKINKFTQVVNSGYVDAFRSKYPDQLGAYTWWSYMGRARERNVGWRIDYFILSNILQSQIHDVIIRNDIDGSDHCPVELYINWK